MTYAFQRPGPRSFLMRWKPWRGGGVCQNAASLTLALLLGLPALSAHAERADQQKPLNFTADNLNYDDVKQVNVLTGHVIITKGTILIRADRVEVSEDPQGYQYATATMSSPGLAYMRQKRDGLDEYFEGQAKSIYYDGKLDVTTLTTEAVARRLAGLSTVIDEIHGNVIRYDGVNGLYTATAGGQGPGRTGRIRGMIGPQTSTAESGAAASPSSRPTAGVPPARPASRPGTSGASGATGVAGVVGTGLGTGAQPASAAATAPLRSAP